MGSISYSESLTEVFSNCKGMYGKYELTEEEAKINDGQGLSCFTLNEEHKDLLMSEKWPKLVLIYSSLGNQHYFHDAMHILNMGKKNFLLMEVTLNQPILRMFQKSMKEHGITKITELYNALYIVNISKTHFEFRLLKSYEDIRDDMDNGNLVSGKDVYDTVTTELLENGPK